MANELAATNCFSEELSYHDDDDQFKALDLCLSALACYSYPFLPIPENSVATSFSTTNNGNAAAGGGATFLMPEEPVRDSKRLKRSFSVSESLGSSDTNGCSSYYGSGSVEISSGSLVRSSSVTSLPRLHFRDHIWTYTQRYLAAEAVEEAVSSFEAENGMSSGGGCEDHQGNKDGMRLVQLLIACAEAVACRDKSHASALLSELRAHAVVFGSSFQRVASCFVQGLADRMTLVQLQPLGSNGFRSPATMLGLMEGVESDKQAEGLSLVYELCPQIQFGHFVANSSILEAFEGESSVHVVDLGMTLGLPGGHQWRQLIHSLANRATGPPKGRLKVTAIGLHARKLQAIGGELEVYAHSMNVNMVFSGIHKCLENIRPEDFDIVEDEVLVVNSIFQLHCVVKESRGALNSVLRIIHKLQPKTLVLVEQDSNHNGPFFLGRFMEALHYYSAIFDSLDAMLPKYDTRRAKMEQFYFAEQIKNIVSCEGPERVERHERVDQWRRRMSRAGFQAVPIKMISQAKQWMARVKLCDGHTIVEEKGCLILGWKSKPIVAASCWKC